MEALMERLTRLARIPALIGVFFSCTVAQAQDDLDTAQSLKKRDDFTRAAPAKDLDAGRSEFESSCAPCHGIDGKGKGPLSEQLKVTPTDLTLLAKKNGGAFPFGAAYEFIDGRKLIAAHGTRDMPIWGQVYTQETLGSFIDPKALDKFSTDPDAVVRDRILSLIDYLNRIQEK
jgi:mono/diheme cytochrome c family protein